MLSILKLKLRLSRAFYLVSMYTQGNVKFWGIVANQPTN